MASPIVVECCVCYDDCDYTLGHTCVGCGVFVCNSCRVQRVLGVSTGLAPIPTGTTDASGLTLTCMSFPACDEPMTINQELHDTTTLIELRKICELQFMTLCASFRRSLKSGEKRRGWLYGVGDNVVTHETASKLARWVCRSLYKVCEDDLISTASPRSFSDLESSIAEASPPPLLNYVASHNWEALQVEINEESDRCALLPHHLLALYERKSVLHHIIEHAPIEILKSYVFILVCRGLLEAALRFPSYRDSIYPIHIAARLTGRAEVLISEGGDINMRDGSGRTVLMYAAAAGNEGCALRIIEHVDDIMATDDAGLSALWYAISHRHPRTLQSILSAVDLRSKLDHTYMIKEKRRSLLDVAILVNSPPSIEVLCRFGASIDVDSTESPLVLAAHKGFDTCFWKLTRGGLGHKPTVNKINRLREILTKPTRGGKTILHIASAS